MAARYAYIPAGRAAKSFFAPAVTNPGLNPSPPQ